MRPHGLRHTAVTTALDATNGDVRSVRRFSRHADIGTVLIYDDETSGSDASRLWVRGSPPVGACIRFDKETETRSRP